MKRRSKLYIPALQHPASMLGAMALFAMLACAMLALVVERVKPEWLQPLKSSSLDIVTPIASLISAPKQTVADISTGVQHFFATYEENTSLRLANQELLKWQTTATNVQHENEDLRALMRMVPDSHVSFVTTRMIGDIGATTSFTALIQAGTKHGVRAHQAVISPEGLIGRVSEVSERHARVLLLSDSNSHIPVVGEKGRQKAMLSGHGHGDLMLRYVERGDQFAVGERLVTSGDGGLLPPGILVGTVNAVEGTSVSVRPLADIDAASIVTVIDYQF